MPRILISGYYGFDNAGDDTVLYGIITSLKKYRSDLELAVLSNKPSETAQLFRIPAYDRWDLFQIARELAKSDLLLMGGGSLLQDATSPRSVIYYLGIAWMAKRMRKPVVFYAQGIGPVTHPLSKWLIRRIVNQIDVITVRDDESANDLIKMGVQRAAITVTADPAVTIHPQSVDLEIGRRILQAYGWRAGQSSIALCIRDWKKVKHHRDVLARLADKLVQEGHHVFFLPMQHALDVEPSRIIRNKMKNGERAVLIEQKLNFKEIMSIIGSMNLVVGMRLHSLILSAILSIPFVAISYDPKIDRFMERLGMNAVGHISDIDYTALEQAVDHCLGSPDKMKNELQTAMKSLIAEAEKSSLLTLEVLDRKR